MYARTGTSGTGGTTGVSAAGPVGGRTLRRNGAARDRVLSGCTGERVRDREMRLRERDRVDRERLESERGERGDRGEMDRDLDRRVPGLYRCAAGSGRGEILRLRRTSGERDLGRTADPRGGERDRLAHELLVEYLLSRPRSVRSLLAHAEGRRVSRAGGPRYCLSS